MKAKIKKYDVVPVILLVYLAVMVWLGYPDYVAGATPAWLYFGGTAFTIVIIFLLRINLKKRAEYRRRRQEDIERNKKINSGLDHVDSKDTTEP